MKKKTIRTYGVLENVVRLPPVTSEKKRNKNTKRLTISWKQRVNEGKFEKLTLGENACPYIPVLFNLRNDLDAPGSPKASRTQITYNI